MYKILERNRNYKYKEVGEAATYEEARSLVRKAIRMTDEYLDFGRIYLTKHSNPCLIDQDFFKIQRVVD